MQLSAMRAPLPTNVLTPAPPPAARGLSPVVWLGGAGLLAAAAAVTALLVFAPGQEVTPPPPPVTEAPAPVEPGVISVETRPAGAEVRVDGELKGTSPIEIDNLPVGSHEVEISLEGHVTDNLSVVVNIRLIRARTRQ